jgi:hypothetical protein
MLFDSLILMLFISSCDSLEVRSGKKKMAATKYYPTKTFRAQVFDLN